jgi:CheY-like chemotaxis protein
VSQNLQILIVDDDPGMARTIRDIFRGKGYEAEVAYSWRETVAEVGKRRFDCILSEIEMPAMGGVELHRLVKETQPKLSVVFMTA